MGVFSRLGAKLGIGSVSVSVATTAAQYHRGSAVPATVRIEGGAIEQDVQMLTVDLVEHWITGSGRNRTHHRHVRERAVAAQALHVGPAFVQDCAAVVHLPDDARCTRRREGWTLCAEAHIRWAVDARAEVPLNVLPHPEVLAVQRATKGLMGFVPVSWEGSAEAVVYDFAAPEGLRYVLDGVAMRLRVVGDMVDGEVVLNRQEHGAGDILRAMVGGDREVVGVAIPRSALLTKRGSPNPAGALPYLRCIYERVGVAPPPTCDTG
ncbi:MAG TPA: sporulation protein [Chthonomonadales bacterium]|nr:sporulation protein [Chthonomonadales bacterium]